MTTRIYTCEGCKATFEGTAEDAFQEGWDTPERFISHCTCPNCAIDKTVWWKVMVKHEEPTEDEARLLQGYNELYEQRGEQ